MSRQPVALCQTNEVLAEQLIYQIPIDPPRRTVHSATIVILYQTCAS